MALTLRHLIHLIGAVLATAGVSSGIHYDLTAIPSTSSNKYLQLLPLESKTNPTRPSLVYLISPTSTDNTQPPLDDISHLLTDPHENEELVYANRAVRVDQTQPDPGADVGGNVTEAIVNEYLERHHGDDTHNMTDTIPRLTTHHHYDTLLHNPYKYINKNTLTQLEDITGAQSSSVKRSNTAQSEDGVESRRSVPEQRQLGAHRDDTPLADHYKNYRISLVFN